MEYAFICGPAFQLSSICHLYYLSSGLAPSVLDMFNRFIGHKCLSLWESAYLIF